MQITSEQEKEVYREAAGMIKDGKPEPEIRKILREKGHDDVYINTVLVNIYNHVNGTQGVAAAGTVDADSGSNGTGSIIFGAVLLIGGVIATAASGGHTIWYGAIIVGIIRLATGIAAASKN
jgi:hypothetical protein